MQNLGRLELLQITLFVSDLTAVEESFQEAYGLEVAFRDPGVAQWGLDNSVLPMGTTFIELLSPRNADTPGGRHLARQGGDSGYMVILQTHDLEPWRRQIEATGVRVAFEAETKDPEHGQDWAGIHLHPGDTGGMMISLDCPDPPDSWVGAGPHWRDLIRQDVVDGLIAIELRSPDPEALASRWSQVLGRPLDGENQMALDQGRIEFRGCREGEKEGLASVTLHASDPSKSGQENTLGGVLFRLA